MYMVFDRKRKLTRSRNWLQSSKTAHKIQLLKSSQNKKELNDVTAGPFLVLFFAAGSWEKETENGAAVTSLSSFLFRDDFSKGWKASQSWLLNNKVANKTP